MKIIIIWCLIMSSSTYAQESWELKLPSKSQEELLLGKKLERLTNLFWEYSSSDKPFSKEGNELIDEIYSASGNYKMANDAKSYAFATMVAVRNIEEWSEELNILLKSDSKQLTGSAIDAIHHVYRQEGEADKYFLLNYANLNEMLLAASERFKDVNISRKVTQIIELDEELRLLKINTHIENKLQEPPVSQNRNSLILYTSIGFLIFIVLGLIYLLKKRSF